MRSFFQVFLFVLSASAALCVPSVASAMCRSARWNQFTPTPIPLDPAPAAIGRAREHGLSDRAALPSLRETAANEDLNAGKRAPAIKWLARTAPEEGVPLIVDMLQAMRKAKEPLGSPIAGTEDSIPIYTAGCDDTGNRKGFFYDIEIPSRYNPGGADRSYFIEFVYELGVIGPPAEMAVPALLDILAVPAGAPPLNSALRAELCKALARIDPSRKPDYEALAPKGSPAEANQAIVALADLLDSSTSEDLYLAALTALRTLADQSATREFGSGLEGFDFGPAMPALLAKLDPKDPARCVGALRVIERIGSAASSAIGAIAGLLKVSDIPTREAAFGALAKIGRGSPKALAAIEPYLSDTRAELRRLATFAAAGLTTHEFRPAEIFMKALEDKDAGVRAIAARAFEGIPTVPDKATEPLLKALDDPSADIRQAAAHSLTGFARFHASADPRVLEALLKKLQDLSQPPMLLFDASCAMEFMSPSTDASLAAVLAATERVRKAVIESVPNAIKNADRPVPRRLSFEEALRRYLEAPEIRKALAIIELGAIGSAAAEAIPALLVDLDAETEEVRQSAAEAILRIDPYNPEASEFMLQRGTICGALRAFECGWDENLLRAKLQDASGSWHAHEAAAIARQMDRPEPIRRRLAMLALQGIGRHYLTHDTAVTKRISAALSDPDPEVRASAAAFFKGGQ